VIARTAGILPAFSFLHSGGVECRCSSVTSLESTLARPVRKCDSKPLTSSLSSLDATLTKNRGRGSQLRPQGHQTCCRFKMSLGAYCGLEDAARSGVPPFDRIPPWLGPRLSVSLYILSQLIVRGRIIRRELHALSKSRRASINFPSRKYAVPSFKRQSHLSARSSTAFGAADIGFARTRLRPISKLPKFRYGCSLWHARLALAH